MNSSSVRDGDLLALHSFMLECSLAWLCADLATYVYQHDYWCIWGSRYLSMGAVIRNIHARWKGWGSHLYSPASWERGCWRLSQSPTGWRDNQLLLYNDFLNHKRPRCELACVYQNTWVFLQGEAPKRHWPCFPYSFSPIPVNFLLFGFIILILCTILYLNQNKARWDLTKLEFITCSLET